MDGSEPSVLPIRPVRYLANVERPGIEPGGLREHRCYGPLRLLSGLSLRAKTRRATWVRPGWPSGTSSSGRSYVRAPVGRSFSRPTPARPMATMRFIVPRRDSVTSQRAPSAKLGACKDPYAHQSELWTDADVCRVERVMAACGRVLFSWVVTVGRSVGSVARRSSGGLVPKNLRELCVHYLPQSVSCRPRSPRRLSRRMSICLDVARENVK